MRLFKKVFGILIGILDLYVGGSYDSVNFVRDVIIYFLRIV